MRIRYDIEYGGNNGISEGSLTAYKYFTFYSHMLWHQMYWTQPRIQIIRNYSLLPECTMTIDSLAVNPSTNSKSTRVLNEILNCLTFPSLWLLVTLGSLLAFLSRLTCSCNSFAWVQHWYSHTVYIALNSHYLLLILYQFILSISH